MVQGTGSNAGKSIINAALCRIMLQDGLRIAPFKAQNMSLNSCVTRNGGEMGRAQVVQAQAAKIDPDVRMNPVLLKPNSDMGSQIIIRGKPVGNMDFQEYIDFKSMPFTAAKEDFESLAAESTAFYGGKRGFRIACRRVRRRNYGRCRKPCRNQSQEK